MFCRFVTGYVLSRAYIFSRGRHCSHDFHTRKCFPCLALVTRLLRLALVTCFPALGTGYMFSSAWHWLHIFSSLAPATCFPALFCTDYMLCTFSWTWYQLNVFPHFFAPVAVCFPALGTGLYVCGGLPLTPVACFHFKFWLTHAINYARCNHMQWHWH